MPGIFRLALITHRLPLFSIVLFLVFMSVHYFAFNSPRYSQFPALILSPHSSFGFLLTTQLPKFDQTNLICDPILLCSSIYDFVCSAIAQ